MAEAVAAHGMAIIGPKSRAFVSRILPQLRRGRTITPKQKAWLRSLHEQTELLLRR